MPDWENNGSYQDLSGMPLARSSMWPTSQAAGNMTSSARNAMTAPGSPPVDPLPPASEQGDPDVQYSGPEIPAGTSGKPQASKQAGPPQNRAAWTKTSTPGVTRET